MRRGGSFPGHRGCWGVNSSRSANSLVIGLDQAARDCYEPVLAVDVRGSVPKNGAAEPVSENGAGAPRERKGVVVKDLAPRTNFELVLWP